jgi:large subunit ribosomal protein L18
MGVTDKNRKKVLAWKRRKKRIRKNVFGTPQRPRLSVHRSLRQFYAQIVDDEAQRTILFLSTLSPELSPKLKELPGKTAKAKLLGQVLAQKLREKGVEKVVFDRGGYKYHGRVRAVAEGAREGGLRL